jgi:DNA polymerase-4
MPSGESPSVRRIAHLDMDAFYASVELLRRPELRGQPLVIGGRRAVAPEGGPGRLRDYAGRGVVTTATYEARAFGIHSGMGLMKAAARCPDALLLPADFDEYRRLSRLFKAAVAELAPIIEDRGIDEIYIDLSQCPGVDKDGGRAIALAIKARIRERCGLSCSIGITPNKLLSKIASELEKPDGLTLLDDADLRTRIWPLPASRINGVGPRASEKLAGLGIETIGDLALRSPEELTARFGRSYGAWLHASAHGRDDRPVVTSSEPRSVSRESTFERDLHPRLDREELTMRFTALCERVAGDLQRKAYQGRTVGVKLRFENFETVTRDQTIASPTCDAAAIRAAARQCLKRIPLERRLRLIGVRVSGLTPLKAPGLSAGRAGEPTVNYELPLFDPIPPGMDPP